MNPIPSGDITRSLLARVTQLIDLEAEDYDSAAARSLAEAQQLVEQGFEFVCDIEGAKLFRKKKLHYQNSDVEYGYRL